MKVSKCFLAILSIALLMMFCADRNQETGMSEKVSSMLQDGKAAFKDGDFDQAIKLLSKVARKAPKNQETHYFLGYSLERKYSNDAATWVNNILPIAQTLKSSKEFQKVIEISPVYKGELLALDPHSKLTSVWGAQAMSFYFNNQMDSAKYAFQYGKQIGGFYPAIMEFNKNILTSCEQNAILFTNGDNDSYPAWYLQIVENYRPDICVINLSLLNLPHYIKFQRSSDCKIDYGKLSDNEIDQLSVVAWQTKKVRVSPPDGSQLESIEWELRPTIMDKGIRVQDIMVLRILEANRWRRPVYFSTTVAHDSKIGLDEYLQMEGLVYQIHPQKVERSNTEIIRQNALEKYQYESIKKEDPKIYNDSIIQLVGNYRVAFFQIAVNEFYAGNKEQMLMTLDEMEQRIPEKLFPITHEETYLQLGILFNESGHPEELERRLEYVMQKPELSDKNAIKCATIYYQYLKNVNKSLAIAEPIYAKNQEDVELISLLLKLYEEKSDWSNAVLVLENWIAKHPNDQQAVAMKKKYEAKIAIQNQVDKSG